MLYLDPEKTLFQLFQHHRFPQIYYNTVLFQMNMSYNGKSYLYVELL